MNFKQTMKKAGNTCKDNSSLLFAIGGVIAAGVTVVLAIKESPKVKLKMADATIKKEEEIRKDLPEDKKDKEIKVTLSTAEKIAIIFRCCWPAIVSGSLSIGCTVLSQRAAGKKIKAARMAADLAQNELTNYMASTVKKVGKKKADEIQEDADISAYKKEATKVNKNGKQEVIVGKGDQLFYDKIMKIKFWSSIDKIQRVRNDINARVLEGEFVPISEFYEDLDVNVDLPLGNILGFGAGVDEIAKNAFMRETYNPRIDADNEVVIILSYICKDKRTYEEFNPDEED